MTTLTASAIDGTHAARVSDFFELLKPRVMTLVVFSGVAGLVMAPGYIGFAPSPGMGFAPNLGVLHPFLALVAIFCIAVGAGASGAINMWYEQDIDSLMNRTKGRPLPQGRVEPSEALAFGVVLTILSVGLMGVAINWTAAALLAFASFFYVFIYTIWLKRRTPQNIVIGGAAGAFPPMIGWAAMTGHVSIESILLFLIIFFWTPPHFWALALFKNDDYKNANVPMLPVVAGERATKIQMLIYTLVMTPLVLAPYFLGMTNVVYLAVAGVLHALFILNAVRVMAEKNGYRFAKMMFGYSIFYLFALFALMMMTKVS